MRNLASKKYGVDMLEPHLPSATLEQVWEGEREGGRERGREGKGGEGVSAVQWSENRGERIRVEECLVGGPLGVLPSPSPGQVLGWWASGCTSPLGQVLGWWASGCTPLPLTRPSAWLVGLWVYSPPPHHAKCLVGGPLGVLPSPSPGQVLGWWASGCTPLPLTRPSACMVGGPLGVLPSPSPGQVLGWWASGCTPLPLTRPILGWWASGCTPLPLTRPSAWLVGLWVYSPPPHQAKCLVGGPLGVHPSPSPGQVLGWWASWCTPLPLTRPSAWLVGLWVYFPPPHQVKCLVGGPLGVPHHQAKCLVGGPLGVLPSPSPGQVLGWWASGCTPLPLTRPSAWLVGLWVYSPPPHQAKCLVGGPLGVLPSPSLGQVLGWWASGCTPLPLTRPSAWLVGLWVYSPPPHQAKCLVGGPLGVLPSSSPGQVLGCMVGPLGVLPSPSPGQVLSWWASGCTPLPLTRPSAWLVGLWVYSPPPHQAKCLVAWLGLWVYSPPPHQAKCLVGGPPGVLPSPSPGQVLGWWASGCTPLPLTRPSA